MHVEGLHAVKPYVNLSKFAAKRQHTLKFVLSQVLRLFIQSVLDYLLKNVAALKFNNKPSCNYTFFSEIYEDDMKAKYRLKTSKSVICLEAHSVL